MDRRDPMTVLAKIWGGMLALALAGLAVTAISQSIGIGGPVTAAVMAMFATANLALAVLLAALLLLVPLSVAYVVALRAYEMWSDRSLHRPEPVAPPISRRMSHRVRDRRIGSS